MVVVRVDVMDSKRFRLEKEVKEGGRIRQTATAVVLSKSRFLPSASGIRFGGRDWVGRLGTNGKASIGECTMPGKAYQGSIGHLHAIHL